MIRKKLDLTFITDLGKKFTLNVDNPKEDLNDESVKSAMENILSLDVFQIKNAKLTALSEAKLTSISTENFNI